MAKLADWHFITVCPRCARDHRLEQCPQVKVIEYRKDGRTIRRVEFFEGGGLQTPAVTTASVTFATGVYSFVKPDANEGEE